MIAYLDTNVIVWLAQGSVGRITPNAQSILDRADLLISPMVLVELEYLFEVKRIMLPAQDVYLKVEHELGVRVCDIPFPTVARVMLGEKWTRDPFDRTIVAQAKANGLAALISADDEIQQHYPRTVW